MKEASLFLFDSRDIYLVKKLNQKLVSSIARNLNTDMHMCGEREILDYGWYFISHTDRVS